MSRTASQAPPAPRPDDLAARRRVLQGVPDQVVDHLGQARPVAGDDGSRLDVHLEGLRPRDGARQHRLDALGSELAEIDRGDVQPSAMLERVGRQQVSREPQRPLCLAADDAQVAALLVPELVAGVLEHQPDIADDRRERSAEVVCDDREQIGEPAAHAAVVDMGCCDRHRVTSVVVVAAVVAVAVVVVAVAVAVAVTAAAAAAAAFACSALIRPAT